MSPPTAVSELNLSSWRFKREELLNLIHFIEKESKVAVHHDHEPNENHHPNGISDTVSTDETSGLTSSVLHTDSSSTRISPTSYTYRLVLSRLFAEVRRMEVEELQEYIQSLNLKGNVHQWSMSVLEEARQHDRSPRKDDDVLEEYDACHHETSNRNTNTTSSTCSTNSISSSSNEMDTTNTNRSSTSTRMETKMNHHLHHNDKSIMSDTSCESSNDASSLVLESNLNPSFTIDPPLIKSKKAPNQHPSTFHRKTFLFLLLLFHTFHTILFDISLVAVSLFVASSYSARYVYQTYYVPIMHALEWTDDRRFTEYTNYRRECDYKDVSTTNPDDLIVDYNTMTVEDAVHLTNRHGMSIFPQILSSESAARMRDFILRKNRALDEDEAIWLIANKNRWSFAIGADQDPSVPPVLKEIAESAFLQATMEGLMGTDPAIVEFTAITSAYGATDQNWHADNEFGASQMHYARSFVPMYSLFIPLQDTTPEMGATSACPGTHLCGEESLLSHICEDLNFQVSDSRGRLAVTEEDHVWKSGDGFLFNLNTYHRGPGHTDPNGPERVMLIMTISNRPSGPHFDRRQMSLGTSYSSRWDAWGLTMSDLKVIDKIMGFPWKYLRTLGIYKPVFSHTGSESVWGWDYLTVLCSRIINEQFGFRRDDLIVWTNRINRKYGSFISYLFGHLPPDGHYELNGWQEYIVESIDRCIHVSWMSFALVSCLYFAIGFLRSRSYRIIRRWCFILSVIGALVIGAHYRIRSTPWAQDIISGRAFESPFIDDDSMMMFDDSLTTVPTVLDVLVPSRLDSQFLAGMNYIFHHQIGNAQLHQHTSLIGGSIMSGDFEKSLIESIKKDLDKTGSRFLRQNDRGDWELMSEPDIFNTIRRSLLEEGNRWTKKVLEQIRFGISECKHGRFRRYIMSRKHGMKYLENLEKVILNTRVGSSSRGIASVFSNIKTSTADRSSDRKIHSSLPSLNSSQKDSLKSTSVIPGIDLKSSSTFSSVPYHVGDPVEAYFEGDGWFPGKIVNVDGDAMAIAFEDGDYKEDMREPFIRPLQPLVIGDNVITLNGDVGTIARLTATGYVELIFPDDTFDIFHRNDLRRIE